CRPSGWTASSASPSSTSAGSCPATCAGTCTRSGAGAAAARRPGGPRPWPPRGNRPSTVRGASMAHVLVTGSAGFIGGYVVQELLDRGHHVTGLDNHSKYG